MAIRRKNDTVLRYVSAVALAAVTWLALSAMSFYPTWLAGSLVLAIGALAAFAPATATILFVIVLSIPVAGADLLAGVAFLVIGLMATQYLSDVGSGAFVLSALCVAALPVHAEWAFAVAAGYLLGRNRGMLAALTACIAAVAAGVALGSPVLGTLACDGAAPALVTFAAAPEGALTFGWLVPAVRAIDPGRLLDAVVAIDKPVLVSGQVLVWTIGALIGASLRTHRNRIISLSGVAAGVAFVALASIVLDATFGGPVGLDAFTLSAAVSLPLALVLAAFGAFVFPPARAQTAAVSIAPAARDVDDLLRTIASAEDELAARHNTEATVLITDMKSFSAMTEDIGSVASAKIVQRHRDLLLPIIAAHGGHGTATGGDGLVAAFRSPAEAAAAAIEIQRALKGYTGSDRSPHELSVRIGVASGEVVLDAVGSPFLGAALNLAARVMDLADGGRIMTTTAVASAARLAEGAMHVHGEFKLKNIAEPVSVAELLWYDGLEPQEIRAT